MTVTTNYLITGNGITGSTANAVQALVSGAGMPDAFASTAASFKLFGGPGFAITAGTTVVTQHPAEAPFSAVQLIYGNWAGSTWTVEVAKVAASPTHLNDGSTTGTPVTVTFNDAGTNVVPVALSGTGNDIVPGLLASDVLTLPSVARTDTPANNRLMIHRVYSAGVQSCVHAADTQGYNAQSNGRQWGSRIPSGDQVTGWTAWAPAETASGGYIQPAVVRFFFDIPSTTIAVCGDSLDRGQFTTANAMGWLHRACITLTTSARVVSPLNFAWSGQTHTATARMAKQVISSVKPNVLVIPVWSPNDTAATQAIMDRCWAETIDVVEYGRQRGVQVWVRTCGPVNAYSAGDDARIKALNTRARAAAGRILVLDHARIIESPLNPAQINAAYNQGDGLHYNDACHIALAAYDAELIRLALGA